jgi:hypothetical protein
MTVQWLRCAHGSFIALQVGGDVVNDKSSAIVTINAVGTIQMANKVATQMLG